MQRVKEHFPPPLWGRVGRGIFRDTKSSMDLCASNNPTPNPSPQGGGEKETV
jgi:hypothetical protein